MWNIWPSNFELTVYIGVIGLIGWGAVELIRWVASYVHVAIG